MSYAFDNEDEIHPHEHDIDVSSSRVSTPLLRADKNTCVIKYYSGVEYLNELI